MKRNSPARSIHSLLSLARKGNERAKNDLFVFLIQHIDLWVRLHRLDYKALRFERSDFVQECCGHIWNKLETFEHENDARFMTWLRKICENKIREVAIRQTSQKRDPRREEHGFDVSSILADHGLSLEEVIEERELKNRLSEEISHLPEREREAVLLHIDGHHPADIAREMQSPESTTRGVLARALTQLSNKLAGLGRN